MWQWHWTFWSTRGARRLDEAASRLLTGCSTVRPARQPVTNGLSVPVPAQIVVEAVFEGTADCVGVPFRAHFRYLGAIVARLQAAERDEFTISRPERVAGGAGRCRPAGGGGGRRLAGGGWQVAGGGRRVAGGWGRRVAGGGRRQAGAGPPQSNEHACPGPAGNRLFGRQLLASSG